MRYDVTLARRTLVVLLTLAAVGCDSRGPGRESPGVFIASPGGEVHTNGVVAIEVVVTGGPAEEVVLMLGDVQLAEMQPPYEYAWDTSVVAEGDHALRARAVIDGRELVSDPRPVVVDRTAPTVTTRSPAPSSTNVSVSAEFEVAFSEPILPATVSATSVVVLDEEGATVPSSAAASAGGDRVTVRLDAVPSVPNTLTVVVTGIADRAGNALLPPEDAWRFELPAWLALGDGFSTNGTPMGPALALDPVGRPVAAWADGASSEARLHVWRWDGDAWDRVGTPRETGAQFPAPELEVDAEGEPIVAVGDGNGFRVDRWSVAAWEPFVEAQSEFGAVTDVALAVDREGAPSVVSSEYYGGYQRLFAYMWDDGAWQPLARPVPGPSGNTFTYSVEPALALDGDGLPVVAWYEESPSLQRGVHVQRWSDDAWQIVGDAPIAEMTDALPTDRAPSLALDSADRPVVAWSEADGTSMSIDVRRWTGDEWQPIGREISAYPGDTPALRPSLVLDADDVPIVAWYESNGATEHVHVARWTVGTWGSIGVLSAHEGATPASVPTLAIGDGGELFAAWREEHGTGHQVHVWRYNQ